MFSTRLRAVDSLIPQRFRGAAIYAAMFAFFAWLFGRALRLAVRRDLTTNDPRVIYSVPIGISYDADLDKARAILLELGGKNRKATVVCGCPVTQLAPSGVILTLDMWCVDALTAIALKWEVLEAAKKRFASKGIGLPVTQSTLVLKQSRLVA